MINIYLNHFNRNKTTSLSLTSTDTKISYYFKNTDELVLYIKSLLKNNNDVEIEVLKDFRVPNNHFQISNKKLIIKKSLKNTLQNHSNFLNELFNA
ncbi:MAG: hypothetical protein GY909_12025 [Oligoflexia bacterium]|nr:hypothetical protein [Oligoflexia bacterium]